MSSPQWPAEQKEFTKTYKSPLDLSGAEIDFDNSLKAYSITDGNEFILHKAIIHCKKYSERRKEMTLLSNL